jgi:aromatic ring-opening dioxygenase catalytic subunit (LigB family)
MGRIVVAAAASHAPGIVAMQDLADPEQAKHFLGGMDHIGSELRAAQPDVIIAVTNEHFANFYLNNVPAMCIGTGASHRGPVEPFMGEERKVPGDRKLAQTLLQGLLDRDFDLSFSEELWFDHGTMVPLHFFNPEMTIPVVPIIVNNIYPPMPKPRRLYHLGQAIASVVGELPEDQRVALVGTGGLSHRVGTPDNGEITVEFDHEFLEVVQRGELRKLAELSNEDLAAAGNGTHEVRNWLSVFGAIGDVPADYTVYEPVSGWATGCGAALWKLGF